MTVTAPVSLVARRAGSDERQAAGPGTPSRTAPVRRRQRRARFRKGAGFERAVRLAGNRQLSRCPVILVAMQESSDLSALRHGVVRRVDGNGVLE
jgi:hypothetical protein